MHRAFAAERHGTESGGAVPPQDLNLHSIEESGLEGELSQTLYAGYCLAEAAFQ